MNKDQASAYAADPLICPAVMCPLACVLETRVAQCNTSTNKCEMIQPGDIACGGHTIHPHSCPAGYACEGAGLPVDAPGQCVPTPAEERCGGITGKQCSKSTDVCVDDPSDSCDPAQGGADCGGICQPAPADCRSTGCATGKNCQFCWVKFSCIPDGAVC